LCFAYLGRLTSEKGLPLLVQAATHLRDGGYDFRLKFIGDGPERERLETITTDMEVQDHVTFTGFLSGKNLQHALNDVAVVVMPSIWEETAGLAAIEQMIRGRMVIAADIGGLGEVVDGVGLKFPMGDVAQLAACMQHLLDEPGMVQSWGQAARTRALKLFRQERMVDEHLKLYREFVQYHHNHHKEEAS
jgi:glycosyltransferase involved in cell wall biosynthesis